MKHRTIIAMIFAIAVTVALQLLMVAGAAAQRAERGAVRTDTRILYQGGPVMVATSNVYFVWYGNWTARQGTVDLLTDFATSYGGSPYAAILTTYPNASGTIPSGGLVYGGSVGDLYSHGPTLSAADVEDVLSDVIDSGALPLDTRGIYLLLTSPDVHFEGFCSERCQYHNYFEFMGAYAKYGVVGNPDRCPTSCAAQFPTGSDSPNADRAGDAMVSWMAHVLNETITNPLGTAWYDRYGLENSDKCVGLFGQTYTTPSGARANMRLSGRDYLIQQNWVNDRKGRCALSY